MIKTEDLNQIKKELVILKSDALPTSYETRIIDVQNNSVVLKNPVPIQDIKHFVTGEQFDIQVRDLKFSGTAVEGYGQHMRLWLSSDSPVTQLEQAKRKSDRTYFYDDERVFCEFQNPHDDQTTLRKRVLDISKSGLGLLTHGNSKLFVPGLKMRDLRIFGDIEADITCDAEVRYSRKYISLNKESCNQVGLEIKVKKS